ncbi:uncharacterized protein SETTUDRAFT_36286 [Exserohilum turcica Et28A]|uniref:Uncharacterized protein n=1 Tax=Exserohilum turcicum (strain 28A) TaxID=671987 RepID=R0J1Y5_EXST2|nr:uncharacterized protein SETTUDRAFT_36286 [Exserohilum turcica Et28A]EOA90776.1 hypothetical protein SETTUDRAFT_36286 [Exserohilum turcica Et28A]
MADSPAAATGALPGESPAQAKARLRRERLAAKSGASRLQQITALQGGPPKDLSEIEKDVPGTYKLPLRRSAASAETSPSAARLRLHGETANRIPVKPSPATPTPTLSRTATPDPDEMDISQHHYVPASHPRLPSPLAFDPNRASPFGPPPASDAPQDPSQDPMMAMLQQMMGASAGGMPGMPGGPGQATRLLAPPPANRLPPTPTRETETETKRERRFHFGLARPGLAAVVRAARPVSRTHCAHITRRHPQHIDQPPLPGHDATRPPRPRFLFPRRRIACSFHVVTGPWSGTRPLAHIRISDPCQL